MKKNFKTLQKCLFWVRNKLSSGSFYAGLPTVLEHYGETDIHYEYDVIFCFSIRKEVRIYLNDKLRFVLKPISKRLLFGLSEDGVDYLILFIPYPSYEKMIVDNILLGYNFPLEKKNFDYKKLIVVLKRLTKKERKKVLDLV